MKILTTSLALFSLQTFSLVHPGTARINVDNNAWLQVSPNVAFQRNADLTDSAIIDKAADEAIHRMLSTPTSYKHGLQSTGTEWNSYQLAWRLLGYYIDCNANDDGDGAECVRVVMYAVVRLPND